MKLILLGAPGAGKGTQAEVVCDNFGLQIISTGNIIRQAVKDETEMGLQAKDYINNGKLVPDDVILKIIKERLSKDDCQNGFILDGVPRTIAQAEALDALDVKIDKVINIVVEDDVICKRLSGRRVCGDCSASYHLDYKVPAKAGVCDRCGGALIVRKDDEPETVKERLNVYHKQTAPLIEYYEKQGILSTVYGQEEVEETSKLLLEVLKEK